MQTLPKAQRTRGLGIGQEGGGCQSRVLLVFPKLNSPKWEKTLFFFGRCPNVWGKRGGDLVGTNPKPKYLQKSVWRAPLREVLKKPNILP